MAAILFCFWVKTNACALRDCLGVSRPFISDTSPPCIDRDSLERCCTGTRQARTQEYRQVFHELTIVDRVVLRGERIVVPAKPRHRMVEILHEGHQGQVRTKRLLRAHVWFPGIDLQCDKFVSTCIPCQDNTLQTQHESLRKTDLPERQWDKVCVDF